SALIASALHRDKVYIWHTDTGECTQVLEVPDRPRYKYSPTRSVTFSHDSTLVLAISNYPDIIQIWRTDTGKPTQKLEGHKRVESAVFSRNSAFVVSASNDQIRVWSTNTGDCVRVVPTGGWDVRLLSTEPGNLTSEPGNLISDLSSTCIVTDTGVVAFTDSATTLTTVGIGLSRDRCWITWNDQKLLWLPVEFRYGETAVRGSTVVIGCDSGRLIVFRFSETALRLIYG
ncbi:Quino protein amine dehydrogenase, partial [Colletotrichum navitas]